MKSPSRILTLLAVGSALALSASISDGASASSLTATTVADGPTRPVSPPAGPGWKTYADSVPTSATVSVVKGRKNRDGSCTLSASGTVPPGGLAVHSDEIAFNASTCESQISEYRLSNEEAVAADAAGESEAGESSSLSATGESITANSTDLSALATYSEGAYSRTWYEDPPGLDVTSVRNSTNWSYNGNCVLSNTARANYSWLSGSGWSKLSDDLNGGYTCAHSISTSYAKFKNGIFCLTIDTYNTYDRNRIYGQENGGYTWSYDVTKSGGCTGLLSVHHSSAFN